MLRSRPLRLPPQGAVLQETMSARYTTIPIPRLHAGDYLDVIDVDVDAIDTMRIYCRVWRHRPLQNEWVFIAFIVCEVHCAYAVLTWV